jgi:hypothetical protein
MSGAIVKIVARFKKLAGSGGVGGSVVGNSVALTIDGAGLTAHGA